MNCRFGRIWALFAGLYTLLAVLGPNGLIPGMVWPDNNQHLLQTRAWIGDDIVIPAPNGGEERHITVTPRLDVTPYFKHRVISDPRDSTVMTNLAIIVINEDGDPLPAQDILGANPHDLRLLEKVVCHVGFPPGPAFFLLPLNIIFHGLIATQWISALLAGLAVALFDRVLATWPDGAFELRIPLLCLAGIGTSWIWLSPDGSTNFFAQVLATTALTGAVAALLARRWSIAGLALALALTSRVSMVGVLPFILWLWWSRHENRSISSVFKLIAPSALAAAVTMILNALRFGSPLDFGYRYMFTPPDLLDLMLEHGQLSLAFLGKNIRYLFLEPPMVLHDAAGGLVFPFLVSDPYGMSLLFVTPASIALAISFRSRLVARGDLIACWLSLILIWIPGLLYFNTGWVQWGGRFLIDGWPLMLLLIAVGLNKLPRPAALALIGLSCLSNLWAVVLSTARIWPACCN